MVQVQLLDPLSVSPELLVAHTVSGHFSYHYIFPCVSLYPWVSLFPPFSLSFSPRESVSELLIL